MAAHQRLKSALAEGPTSCCWHFAQYFGTVPGLMPTAGIDAAIGVPAVAQVHVGTFVPGRPGPEARAGYNGSSGRLDAAAVFPDSTRRTGTVRCGYTPPAFFGGEIGFDRIA